MRRNVEEGSDRRVILLVAVILLAFTTLAASLNYLQNQNPSSGVPAEITAHTPKPSQYGNLTQYTLVLNCALDDGVESAPAIDYGNVTITLDEARRIARDTFGFDAPSYEESTTNYVYLKQGKEALQFNGLNKITYTLLSYRTPIFGDWDEAWAARLADEYMDRLDPVWGFETDAVRRLDWVGVASYASPGDTENVTKLEARYVWSVEGIDVVGVEDYVRLKADGVVVNSEATKPRVEITGRQSITVTPEEALQNFIDGWDANSVIGEPEKRPDKPVNGTLIIEGVRPVYYIVKVSDTSRAPLLLYQIHARIVYEDEEGLKEIDIYDYQYAN